MTESGVSTQDVLLILKKKLQVIGAANLLESLTVLQTGGWCGGNESER